MRESLLKVIGAVLFGLVLFSCVGCGSQKQVVAAEPKQLPSWYINPPQSNQSDLYAVGDGKDKQEAIANALAQMASTLSVFISSTYSAKTVVKEGRVSSSDGIYVSDTQSNTQEIRISNYELLQAESFGFKKYAVLVRSNKQKLFQSMKQEIEQNFKLIEQNEDSISSSNALKQLSFYKKTKESLLNLPNTLIVMNVLVPNFDGSLYLQKKQRVDTKYETTLRSITFSIDTDTNAINLEAPIAKGLSEKKFKLQKGEGNTHFNLFIVSKIQKASSYGFSLARTSVTFVTKDMKGAVIGSNTLNIVGQSSQGFEIAKQNVAVKLSALVQKEGIGKIIGLDI